jgi:GNAT superfamily N-acetyltransferase
VKLSLEPPTAEEFKDLYEETGWGDWSLSRFESALAGTWIFCSARDSAGLLIGIGRLISDGALHAFVTELIVRGDARGRGIGAQILARLVAEAQTRGVTDVQLFAAKGRTAFYERNGFERRPDDSPGMDVVAAEACDGGARGSRGLRLRRGDSGPDRVAPGGEVIALGLQDGRGFGDCGG